MYVCSFNSYENNSCWITYASFAGLCIIATTLVGIYKFNQMPDLFTTVGLVLIISGVLIVNLLGKTN